MSASRRRAAWCALILCAVVLLCRAGTARLRRFYGDEPGAAYYRIARALQENDQTTLSRLTTPTSRSLLRSLAADHGGERALGRRMAGVRSPDSFIHTHFVVGFRIPGKRSPAGSPSDDVLLFQWWDGEWHLWMVHNSRDSSVAGKPVSP